MSYQATEKVFAKVKGYPFWPARINVLPEEVKVPKGKYPIFFYGTHEVCFASGGDIKPYHQNKEKLGQACKRPHFNEGLVEIEEDPDVLLYGKDPMAESFLMRFYKFTPKIPWATSEVDQKVPEVIEEHPTTPKRSRKSVKPMKPASPVSSLSSAGSDSDNEPLFHLKERVPSGTVHEEMAKSATAAATESENESTSISSPSSVEAPESPVTPPKSTSNKRREELESRSGEEEEESSSVTSSSSYESESSKKMATKRPRRMQKPASVTKAAGRPRAPKPKRRNSTETKAKSQSAAVKSQEDNATMEARLLICNRDIKLSLLKGRENYGACVSALQNIFQGQLRFSVLCTLPEVMDTIRKCRKYRPSPEVQRLAQLVYTRFLELYASAGQEEIRLLEIETMKRRRQEQAIKEEATAALPLPDLPVTTPVAPEQSHQPASPPLDLAPISSDPPTETTAEQIVTADVDPPEDISKDSMTAVAPPHEKEDLVASDSSPVIVTHSLQEQEQSEGRDDPVFLQFFHQLCNGEILSNEVCRIVESYDDFSWPVGLGTEHRRHQETAANHLYSEVNSLHDRVVDLVQHPSL